MKKIAIFGSRDIDTEKVTSILYELMVKDNWYITSGNIKGAAECARNVAEDKGIKITLYNYESGLGFYIALKDITVKNKKMVEECEEAFVFWNGDSKGTEREIKMLKRVNKPYQIFNIGKPKFSKDELSFEDLLNLSRTTGDVTEMEHLCKHKDWRVRRELLTNPNIPESIIHHLSNDESSYVRYKVNEKQIHKNREA